MTDLVYINGWYFDFGKGIAYHTDPSDMYPSGVRETRFRLTSRRGRVTVLIYTGTWWKRGFFDQQIDKQITDAYEHWQFERIILR